MKGRSSILLTLTLSLSVLLLFLIFARKTNNSVSQEQIEQIAKTITVKILDRDKLGSGIIVAKQGSLYTVLTNEHVLLVGKPPYQVKTFRDKVYPAVIKSINFQGKDLSLLEFRAADVNYVVAQLGAGIKPGENVFAAGFPVDYEATDNSGFVFRTGQVSLILYKALEGGYQIGYTNDIEKGMSGGPLLNSQGQLVAVNGMHAEPLFGEPYVYEDGTSPELSLRKQMTRYSWGIPIETYLKFIKAN